MHLYIYLQISDSTGIMSEARIEQHCSVTRACARIIIILSY